MIDNQDRCEWVNVTSGTGSPSLSRTKGRKMLAAVVRITACSGTKFVTVTKHFTGAVAQATTGRTWHGLVALQAYQAKHSLNISALCCVHSQCSNSKEQYKPIVWLSQTCFTFNQTKKVVIFELTGIFLGMTY